MAGTSRESYIHTYIHRITSMTAADACALAGLSSIMQVRCRTGPDTVADDVKDVFEGILNIDNDIFN